MERHARPELEGIGQVVGADAPALGQLGHDPAGRIERDEALENVAVGDFLDRLRGPLRRVKDRRLQRHAQCHRILALRLRNPDKRHAGQRRDRQTLQPHGIPPRT